MINNDQVVDWDMNDLGAEHHGETERKEGKNEVPVSWKIGVVMNK